MLAKLHLSILISMEIDDLRHSPLEDIACNILLSDLLAISEGIPILSLLLHKAPIVHPRSLSKASQNSKQLHDARLTRKKLSQAFSMDTRAFITQSKHKLYSESAVIAGRVNAVNKEWPAFQLAQDESVYLVEHSSIEKIYSFDTCNGGVC